MATRDRSFTPLFGAASLLGLLALVGPAGLEAQETEAGREASGESAPMVTDRPDRTESAATVAPGRMQLEGGWSLGVEEADRGELRDHAFGELLARIGVLEFLEARVGFGGFRSRERAGAGRTTAAEEPDGFADLSLGVKARLHRGGEGSPAVALLASTTLPSGEAPFSSERADPELRIAVEQELGAGFSLGINSGVAWESRSVEDGGRERLADVLYTLAVGYAITERLGAFAESFGFLPASEESVGRHALDGGLTYALLPNLQLDVSGGVGLEEDAEDWLLGAGVSIRAPR